MRWSQVGVCKWVTIQSYPPLVATAAIQLTGNEVLLGVYVDLEKSNNWTEFIESPLLEPLADKELKARHEDEYVKIMRASCDNAKGPVYCYIPRKFGSLLMWIDVYDYYKIKSGNPWNRLRMAGMAETPLMGYGGLPMDEVMDYVHVLEYFQSFGKLVRAGTFHDEDHDILIREMRLYKFGAGQFHVGVYGTDPPPYGEHVAAKETPQPPRKEPVAAVSASSSASPVVGVADDSLVTASIAAEATVGATTGAAQPGVIMETLGGIGTELQLQIGLDLNLLTLAGRTIFKL